MKIKSYAKVNLALEIIGKRLDGYHEINTVFQSIDVHDVLSFRISDSLSLTASNPTLEDPENLVLKAAELLKQRTATTRGVAIHLDKQIPMASGLGGGSSNAAATLVCLNELWDLNLDHSTLAEMGALIGSDVPYFIHGGTALGTNKGDQINGLPAIPKHWLILVNGGAAPRSKTELLYSKIRREDYTMGESVASLAGMIKLGQSLKEEYMVNTFESVASEVFPDLERRRQVMLQNGVSYVHLSGAGPMMFAFVENQKTGLMVEKLLRNVGLDPILSSTVGFGWEKV